MFEINESFNLIEVSEADIEKCFACLNPHHCPVPDNLHLLIIITCKDSIKVWLKVALNLSLSLGIVSSSWKMPYVSLLHKSGDEADINNYRPFTQNNIFLIMFDFLVYRQIQSSDI